MSGSLHKYYVTLGPILGVRTVHLESLSLTTQPLYKLRGSHLWCHHIKLCNEAPSLHKKLSANYSCNSFVGGGGTVTGTNKTTMSYHVLVATRVAVAVVAVGVAGFLAAVLRVGRGNEW